MALTIIKALQQTASYPMLRKVAEENHVQVTGDERVGTFSCRGVEGCYEFRDDGLHGKFAGHGIEGEFTFAGYDVSVTVTKKSFWLPESLLKRTIEEGLDSLKTRLTNTTV
jgi:hypothetical protein